MSAFAHRKAKGHGAQSLVRPHSTPFCWPSPVGPAAQQRPPSAGQAATLRRAGLTAGGELELLDLRAQVADELEGGGDIGVDRIGVGGDVAQEVGDVLHVL